MPQKRTLERVDLIVKLGKGGIDQEFVDCVGFLDDGTEIQLPVIGFEDDYTYNPKSHVVSLRLNGMRARILRKDN